MRFSVFAFHFCLLMGNLSYSLHQPATAYAEEVVTADVVIYGGTSAGVIAAVQCKRLGKTALIIEPSTHLGGLTSGGLGWTDSGNKSVIGGLSREYYQRIKQIYDQPETWKWIAAEEYSRYRKDEDAMWVFEPHIAEKIFEDLIVEYEIPVYLEERLNLEQGVTKQNGRVISIHMESGLTARGTCFIDTTYEGDLMAKAGVSYTVGREANSQYGETLNGVQKVRTIKHQFETQVSPFKIAGDPSSGLLPGIHGDDPGEDGSGDHRVQAYCFRMCLSNHPENRIPFPKPDNYNAERYELLARYLATGWKNVFNKFDVIPNRKTDTNNHGAFSTDNIGMNYDYPDGDYQTRAAIIEEHRNYQQGFLWFLANDPRVPDEIRERMNQWGLAADEFLDNEHWPHQIYVREARRMVSDFVMSELHLRRQLPTPEPIGMGSYNMDSHNVQRYVTPQGYARNEGDIQVNPGGPYPVSYRAIVPKQQECSNLLVPVCLSSSHIAYGSIRMEPVFMILAHSAATAACQSIDRKCAVQEIDYETLKERLLADGQVLAYSGPYRTSRMGIDPKSLSGGLVIDNLQAQLQGDWVSSTSTSGYVSANYLHDDNSLQGQKSVSFPVELNTSGMYEVRISYSPHSNRASNVHVGIHHQDGKTIKSVNQKKQPDIAEAFVSLGRYRFSAKEKGHVVISNMNADGFVIADAIWVVPAAK